MKLQKANSDKFEEHIKYYKVNNLESPKLIVPQWAYGNNADNILDITLQSKSEEYLRFFVDTSELIHKAELHEVNSQILFTGEILNDGSNMMFS